MSREIERWLSGLGLDRYAATFAENDIDARSLPLLTGDDLREMGVSLGHRRLMLSALATREGAAPEGGTAPPPAPIADEPPEPAPSAPAPAPAPPSPTATPAPERRHLTVLFADLVGSTELTNRLDPEDMRTLLQRYQDRVAGAVSRYGGFVAKYLGDGLLVFFGWPRAYEDHHIRAVKAGLETVRRVAELTAPDGTTLAARVGIASGDVVVGDTIGQNTHEESAMTGPSVNLAARIQELAPPGTVVLTQEDSAPGLPALFDLAPLGEVALKGFDTPRNLLQVKAERSAESRFRATHSDDLHGGIIGREQEMGILRQAWDQARAGRGEVVLLTGEAGIGKSRLAESFLAGIAAQSADIIRLNCSPYLTSSPFHPLTERISQDAGVAPDFDDDRVLDHVRELLASREGVDVEAVLPVYAALVAPGSDEAGKIKGLSPEEQRDLTIRTLVSIIKLRCAVRPVLMVVEDAHWIDPSTKALLSRIGAICADLPLLVLITHRPGWDPDWAEGDTHVQSLQLRRLDPRQVAMMVERITGSPPEPRLVGDILEKTDGVPLYVEEVTRALATSEVGHAAQVPSSLRGALMARLDAVSEEAKQVALSASVIGRDFERALLSAMMDRPPEQIAAALEELRCSGLIFESGHHRGHHVFRHALIRDTAYNSMVTETRRGKHARVAQALLDLRAAEVDRRPELVARHLTEAGDNRAAYDRWFLAAEKALARSASQEAVVNAEETLAAAKHLEPATGAKVIRAQILVGRSYESSGRLPDSLIILRQASDSARAIGDRELFADAANHFTEASLLTGEGYDTAARLCEEALSLLSDTDEARRCTLFSQLARAYMNLGAFDRSAEYSRKALALALAEKLGDTKAQFALMMARFAAPFIAREEQDRQKWRQNLAAMRRVASRLDTLDRGRDRTLHLFICAEMADRAGMERSLSLLAEVAHKERHPQLYWVHTNARAMIAILDGDFELAENCADEAYRLGKQTHGKHLAGVYGVQMFTLRREQGRLQEVAPIIKRLMEDSADAATWKPGFAVIAAELGFKDAARRLLEEMGADGFDLHPDAMYSTILSYLAEICIAVEHHRHAETIFDLLRPYEKLTITAGATTVCLGAAARRLGGLAALLGDWETAEQMFATALQVDRSMRAPPWIAHDMADLAAALRRRGRRQDQARALTLETEALKIAQNSGMIALGARLRGQPN